VERRCCWNCLIRYYLLLNVGINNIYLCTDSILILLWMSLLSTRLNTVVANRVSRIQDTTNARNWKPVPTSDNPADLIGRTATPKLVKLQVW